MRGGVYTCVWLFLPATISLKRASLSAKFVFLWREKFCLQINLTKMQCVSSHLQIVQQIVGPNGEIQQIPIQLTSQQLGMIRAQMTGD